MSHPGTYVNAPTLGVPGLVVGDANTAVSFDASGTQYVIQTDSPSAQVFTAFTLGCLFKPSDPTDPTIPTFWGVSGATAPNDGIGFNQITSGAIAFFGDNGTEVGDNLQLVSATTFLAGTTYRLIGTWDGVTAKLYVDGVLDASAAYSGVIQLVGTDDKFVAASDAFLNPSIQATLDECFFVANHAATAPEIAAIDAAMTGTGDVETEINALSPYIYWRLGESSGTVAEDSASGGLTYTPPIAYDMGPIIPDTHGLQRLLFRHYSPHGRFQTVWKLATDPITYSLTQPYPLITPEDVNQGNTPIGQQYNAATYLHVYYGPELVDADEAARLVASGIGTVT